MITSVESLEENGREDVDVELVYRSMRRAEENARWDLCQVNAWRLIRLIEKGEIPQAIKDLNPVASQEDLVSIAKQVCEDILFRISEKTRE